MLMHDLSGASDDLRSIVCTLEDGTGGLTTMKERPDEDHVMTRHRYLVALTFAVTLMVPTLAPLSAGEPARLTILHFNDLDRMEERRGRGGIARLAAIISAERAKGGQVLATFGGDAISPSLMSGFDQGAHMIDLLNRLDLTAMAIGNHEYDFGPDVVKERIAEASFPMLGANNMDRDGELVDGALASIMIEAGEYTIGMFGLTTQGTMVKSSPGYVTLSDPVAVAGEQSAALREAGADLVIALAHTDRSEDAKLIEQGVVDILLSGDDHMLMADYGKDTLFVESGEQADWVTAIDLHLVETGEGDDARFRWSAEYRIIDSAHVEPDPDLTGHVETYLEKLSTELDIEIGTVSTPLDSRRTSVRLEESAIANLIVDAMREATGADVGLTNGGGIRGNRTYDADTVLTRRDIQTELPFGNTTVLLEITGRDLIAALENGFSEVENRAGRFPHVSGVSVVYDPAKLPGSRVLEVAMNGKELNPDATLTLATNNYMAGGGDGYAMLENQRRIIDQYSGRLMALQVIDHIVASGTVSPTIEGRIMAVKN